MKREFDDDRLWERLRESYSAPPPDDHFVLALERTLERELRRTAAVPGLLIPVSSGPPASRPVGSRFAPACAAALAVVSIGLLALGQRLNPAAPVFTPVSGEAQVALVQVPFQYTNAVASDDNSELQTFIVNWADQDGEANGDFSLTHGAARPDSFVRWNGQSIGGPDVATNGAAESPQSIALGNTPTFQKQLAAANGRALLSAGDSLRNHRLVVRGHLQGVSDQGLEIAVDRVIFGADKQKLSQTQETDGIAALATPQLGFEAAENDVLSNTTRGKESRMPPGCEAILFCNSSSGIAAVAAQLDSGSRLPASVQPAADKARAKRSLDLFEAEIVETLERGDFLDFPLFNGGETAPESGWSHPQQLATVSTFLVATPAAPTPVVVKAKLDAADASSSRWNVIHVLSGGWPHAVVTLDQQLLRQRAEAIARFRARSAPASSSKQAEHAETVFTDLLQSEFVSGRVALLFLQPEPHASDPTSCRLLYRTFDEPPGKLAAVEQFLRPLQAAVDAAGQPTASPGQAPP